MALTKVTYGLLSADTSAIDLNIDANTLYVDSSANSVGIGTNSPGKSLHVYHATTDYVARFESGDNQGGIELKDATSTSSIKTQNGTLQLIADSTNDVGSSAIIFRMDNLNSGEIARFDVNGNLGIGETSPSRKLHVSGAGATVAAKIQATDGNQTSIDLTNTEGAVRLINDGGSFFIYDDTNGAERLRINTSGNVGIGSTTPTTHINTGTYFKPDSNGRFLTLNGGANGSFLMFESSTTTDSDQIGGIFFTRTAGQGDAHKQVAGIDVIQDAYGPNNILEGGTLRFFTKQSGSGTNASRMVINGDGKVGIGTTTPQAKLQVADNEVFIHGGTTTTGPGIFLGDNNFNNSSYYNSAPGIGAVGPYGGVTAGLAFYYYGSQANSRNEAMRIDSSGNVGINNTSPGAQLQVNYAASSITDATGLLVYNTSGSQGNRHGISLQSAGGIDVGIGFYAGTTAKWSLMYDNAETGLHIYDEVNSNKVLTARAGGNIGIGTNAPISELDVRDGVITAGSYGGTNGALAIQDYYSGNDHLGNIGFVQSSGGVYLAYGVKQDGSSDWKSTYDNFSGAKAYVKLDNDTFYLGYSAAAQVTVGNTVTMTDKYKFDLANQILYAGAFSGNQTIQFQMGNNGTTRFNFYDNNNTEGSYFKSTGTSYGGVVTMGARWDDDEDKVVFKLLQNSANSSSRDCRVGFGTTTPNAVLTLAENKNYNPPGLGNTSAHFAILKRDAVEAGNYGQITGIKSSGDVWTQVQRVDGVATSYAMILQPSGGNIGFGTESLSSRFTFQGTTTSDVVTVRTGSSANANVGCIVFRDGSSDYCGQITCNGSTNSVSYVSSSDYRLKENEIAVWDGTTILKQLTPYKFNWKANPTGEAVQGFFAHEVAEIIPEAVVGEKDAVDSEGHAEYQGIDPSKLVPLLVKTIQELEARITELESK